MVTGAIHKDAQHDGSYRDLRAAGRLAVPSPTIEWCSVSGVKEEDVKEGANKQENTWEVGERSPLH